MIAVLYLFVLLISVVFGGWIDPDSVGIANEVITSNVDGSKFSLVFSDEFNRDGRSFADGADPRWTAVNKNDYTNYALQYYSSNLVQTSNGFLNITTEINDITFLVKNDKKKPYLKTKNYQSGMVQGWNKFCFTGGIVEISAKLPGRFDVGGLWPAMWLLGNLARATYVGSSNNVWPWSYNTCSREMQRQQRFSACNEVTHYGLTPKQGRGAPEVDIMEAMPGKERLVNTDVQKPYVSASYQVSPGRQDYRPVTAWRPDPNASWYDHGIEYGANASLNIFFYGMSLAGATKDLDYVADAVSANRNVSATHFNDFHKYRLEWKGGKQGYLKWYLDDEFVYGIDASALSSTGAMIPEEPMHLILNTAISSTWGFPTPCPYGCACDCFDCRKYECQCGVPGDMCSNLPAHFLIDYVRVYQDLDDSDQTVGCSTLTHPTKTYIEGNKDLYMDPSDSVLLRSVQVGGGACQADDDCGGEGECRSGACECLVGFVGPHCLAAKGFDDYTWEKPTPFTVFTMFLPSSLVWLLLWLLAIFSGLVGYSYWRRKHPQSGGVFSAIVHSQSGYQAVPDAGNFEMTGR